MQCKERSLDNLEIPANGGLVKVLYAGVCHSDIHYCEGEYKLSDNEQLQFFNRPGYAFPKVPGHEVCGVVAGLGSGVPHSYGVSVGDRVCIFSWMGCGKCECCNNGDTDCCRSLRRQELGMVYDGGFSQYVVVPDYRTLLHTPDTIPSELACTLSCGCLTTYNACKTMLDNIPNVILKSVSELHVAVIGLGGLGQWCLKLLPLLIKSRGLQPDCLRITGIDVSDERLEPHYRSKSIASKFVIDGSKLIADIEKDILSNVKGAPFHAVIDFVNNPLTFTTANRIILGHGVLVSVGLFGGSGEVRLPLLALKRHKIIGVQTGSLNSFRELLEFVGGIGNDLEGPSIDVYPLSECNEVIKELKKGKIRGRAILKCN